MVSKIWKRQKGEQSKTFAKFKIYRDLGGIRSLEKVREKIGQDSEDVPTLRNLEMLSSRWNWVARAEAYDDYLDDQVIESNIEEIKKMNERHIQNAIDIQDQALEDYRKVGFDENTKASIESRKKMAASTWELGVKTERLARGVATEKVEQFGKVKQEHSGGVKTEFTGKYEVTKRIICSKPHIDNELEVLNAVSKAQGCDK